MDHRMEEGNFFQLLKAEAGGRAGVMVVRRDGGGSSDFRVTGRRLCWGQGDRLWALRIDTRNTWEDLKGTGRRLLPTQAIGVGEGFLNVRREPRSDRVSFGEERQGPLEYCWGKSSSRLFVLVTRPRVRVLLCHFRVRGGRREITGELKIRLRKKSSREKSKVPHHQKKKQARSFQREPRSGRENSRKSERGKGEKIKG